MIILVGLGNPGEKYARHRHNIGFMAADAIADAHGFGPSREKFHALVREGVLSGEAGRDKALIIKPLTFMNDSGRAVRAAADFYKVDPQDVVVFYDELDLAPGKLRVKTGGGAAGHNGIRSIDAHLGNEFRRVRIGIGHPGQKSKVTSYVLGNFAKADEDWLGATLDAIAAAAPHLISDDQRFASDVAQRLAPMRKADAPASKGETSDQPPSPSPSPSPSPATPEPSEKEPGNPFADAFRKLIGRADEDT